MSKKGKKLTYEYVKNYIEKEGYTLLSNTYKNANTKLNIKCPEDHQYEVIFNSFKKGHRCPYCAGNKKLTYEYVKNYIEKEGYILLSDTYKNTQTKLKIKCPKGHVYYILFNDFKSGHRCFDCRKYSRNDFKKMIEKEGYILLSNDIKYKDVYTKFKIQCPKGHVYYISFSSFKSGHRCSICYHINKKHSYKYVKNYIEKEGYTLLSNTYKNTHIKLLIQCPEGHQYNVKFYKFKQGQRCPVCNKENITSKGEKQVAQFVRAQGINIIENDRSQILNPLTNKNLELDIWIPSLNKAIEYNGLYWHSFKDAQRNDKIKKQQCKELGIDLLIITDNNWTKNQIIEQQIIKKFLCL